MRPPPKRARSAFRAKSGGKIPRGVFWHILSYVRSIHDDDSDYDYDSDGAFGDSDDLEPAEDPVGPYDDDADDDSDSDADY